jgi:threonine dehydrogenase-like Zn-dependent dehydrogenase
MATMRAAVFLGKGQIKIREVPRPEPGPGEALVRITLTTICGTDVHILKGEYPIREGLVVGHEPVGRIEALGAGVRGFEIGDRVIIGAIKRLTGGGADVTIEALGRQETFENALRSVRPGGTLSSLGVYSGHLQVPLEAFGAGLADHTIVTTLCPGGKERMRRLMNVARARRFPFRDLVTHSFRLEDIEAAYDLFANQRDGVMKIAIRP